MQAKRAALASAMTVNSWEDDYKAGRKRKEYERRKDEIGDRSLIY